MAANSTKRGAVAEFSRRPRRALLLTKSQAGCLTSRFRS